MGLAALFWAGVALVVYTYLGYGLVVWGWLKARKAQPRCAAPTEFPAVTLLIAAYNEADILPAKVANCYALDYPAERLHFLFVTDGSSDGSPELLRQHERLQVMHEPARRGKIAAVARAMQQVRTPITVLTDANTFLNTHAIKRLVAHFEQPSVGAVAGEKRVRSQTGSKANAQGEGLYWRYESWLKAQDADLYSVVGAAGELYALRTHLFQDVPPDTILDDFMQTLLIAQAGYRVAYAPDAYAEEDPSADLGEELKRKVRICAGGFQSMGRLLPLLNPLRYGVLSFQYVSHRVLRWTLAPLMLPIILVANVLLAVQGAPLYQALLGLQLAFYATAGAGYLLRGRRVPVPGFFVPLYFCIMNYSVFAGFWRFLNGRQSVNWEKAKRAT